MNESWKLVPIIFNIINRNNILFNNELNCNCCTTVVKFEELYFYSTTMVGTTTFIKYNKKLLINRITSAE